MMRYALRQANKIALSGYNFLISAEEFVLALKDIKQFVFMLVHMLWRSSLRWSFSNNYRILTIGFGTHDLTGDFDPENIPFFAFIRRDMNVRGFTFFLGYCLIVQVTTLKS
jgi:hypothetical protein